MIPSATPSTERKIRRGEQNRSQVRLSAARDCILANERVEMFLSTNLFRLRDRAKEDVFESCCGPLVGKLRF